MKKLFFLGIMCLGSTLCLFGCGNNQEAVLTNLANKIDLLNNTVSSVSYAGEKIPSISSLTTEQAKNYAGIYQSAKDIIKNQNDYKTAIIAKNGLIKNKIANKEISLTNQNCKALIDLTNSLARNTKNLNETKSEFTKSVTEVKKTIDNSASTTAQISAKLNRLSNCMDSQNCFYKNLLNTLNNIEKILEIEDNSFDYSTLTNLTPSSLTSTENTTSENETFEEDNSKDFQELLYHFLLNNYINNQNLNNNCNNCESNKNEEIINNNETEAKNLPQNLPNYNAENFNNGNLNNSYNNLYPNNRNFGYNYLINPSRNTDTYRPWTSNIDTYRFNPNINQRFNNIRPMAVFAKQETNSLNETEKNIKMSSKKPNKFGGKGYKNKEELIAIMPDENQQLASNQINCFKPSITKKGINDINKKIENLIKKDSKETFNSNNFIKLG